MNVYVHWDRVTIFGAQNNWNYWNHKGFTNPIQSFTMIECCSQINPWKKGNSHRHRRSLNIEHFKLPSRWRTATTPSYQHSAKAGWVNKNHLARGDPPRPWWSQFRCLAIFDSSWKLRFAQVFYALVFLLGVVGNTLVIYVVIRFSKMHTVNDDKPISKGTSHNLS